MAWIGKSKLYESERWYCSLCGCRRKVTINQEWVEIGKPYRVAGKFPFDWFVKCSHGHTIDYVCSYDCPHCGRPLADEQEPLKVENYKTDQMASYRSNGKL
jgi:hypothetical protein